MKNAETASEMRMSRSHLDNVEFMNVSLLPRASAKAVFARLPPQVSL